MAGVFKFLLFFFVAYFLFSLVKRMLGVGSNSQRGFQQPNVRIFKKGDVETPKLDMNEAETVDYEEIEIPKKDSNHI